ncbi:MAG: S1 RNA-binding domain-containing protein [Candidatus Wallbacteria bacterium]|nr:S1 RNA-binding domain-containing protein [Candidatus Wallbacteria bacterium]
MANKKVMMETEMEMEKDNSTTHTDDEQTGLTGTHDDTQVEENMDSFMEKYMGNVGTLARGNIVKGIISDITGTEVFVDIGHKAEGIISSDDFANEPDQLKVGQEIEVMVISLDGYGGYPILSKSKADLQKSWNQIYSSYETGSEVSAKVGGKIKGGYEVFIEGSIKAFLPLSQVTDDVRSDETLDFRVIEANRKRNNVVVSRKVLLQEEKKKRFDKIFSEHQEGDVVNAKVVRIKDYGAFLDFAGVEGLLHITDMSWGRTEKVEDAVTTGQELDVKIIKVDRETNKVSFGIKQLKPEPWSFAAEKFPHGTVIEGKVTKLTDFGIFVRIEEGLEGLVHISDLSWTIRYNHPKEFINAGETIKVLVLNIDTEARRISLGVKQLSEDPWDKIEEFYSVNSIVTGKVEEINRGGFTVRMENELVGFVSLRDISWTRKVPNASEVVSEGQSVEVKVLELDKSRRRISLGLKQVQPNPWSMALDNYPPGTVLEGKIANLAKFGAFCELPDGIEGLIHVSDMSWTKKVSHPSEILSKGDKVKVRVLEVNIEEQKIALGLKQVMADPWSEIDAMFPVGDTVEGRVVSLTNFGVFVEIAEGIEGMVHISDLHWNKKINHPGEMVSIGEQVRVKVLELDSSSRKIKLGLKQVTEDPFSKFRKGAIFEGEISKISEFGLFVKLAEGVEGLVHKSHLIDEDLEDLSSVYHIGEKLAVMVIETNKDKRQLRLSAKEALNVRKIEEYRKNLDTNISGGVSLAEKLKEALAEKSHQEEKQ